jgi:Zn-dependent M28 family amino/carboxypeptidase
LCPCPGWGAQIVLVGCHLDSTAASDGGYNPALDAAPGADDDASGIAATLALARYMTNFRGKLTHTVRFCFFNAEESGMIGSKAYAAMLKASGAPVKGAVCMDMIGYNSDTARIFEIHAGYTDPTIRDASIPIANAVASWAAAIGTLAPAQIYQGTSTFGAPNRMVYDGAINRSDHASFHQQGYPAVVVSEDFFANLVSEPSDDPNPNYHRHGDTVIDSAYASDITCAVAFAVKDLANA